MVSEHDRPPGPPDARTISAALGGPLGVVESAVPAAAFTIAYTVSDSDQRLAAAVALVIAALLTVARLVRGQTLQYALSGVAGVGLAAFIVSRTGRAEDFFLPGLLINAAYAAGYAISILVGWPLLGVIVASVTGQGMAWRRDPAQVRMYSRASWLWVGLFLLRLAVQLPLYLAGAVVALGTARVAMGIPLFALGIWLSWLVLRREHAAMAGGGPPAAPAASA
jgi:Protein of unknown function (DUF3159)